MRRPSFCLLVHLTIPSFFIPHLPFHLVFLTFLGIVFFFFLWFLLVVLRFLLLVFRLFLLLFHPGYVPGGIPGLERVEEGFQSNRNRMVVGG